MQKRDWTSGNWQDDGIELDKAKAEIEGLKSELEIQCNSQISAVNQMLAAEQREERLRAALETIAYHRDIHSDFPNTMEAMQSYAYDVLCSLNEQ